MTATPLTFIIIGLTVLISWQAFQNPNLLSKYMLNPYQVKHRKQYYRFLSSGFIHAGWMHLLFNMFTFYFFAQTVEFRYVSEFGLTGYFHFLLVYIGGMIVADIPTYLKYKDVPHYNSLGASGGVAAVLFNSVLFYPLNQVCLYGFLCIPGFIWAIIYIIYSHVYDRQGSGDNINHSAHLYGALYGFGIGVVINPMSIVSFFEQLSRWRMF